ncbi:MAG: MerR family transcriptional regulator [Oscillospiraceae bacterium]
MNKRKNNFSTDGLIKISELATLAGESVSTVKYYVKEGLVETACKTGKNMAYYAPESVERVKLIRTLQTEKFYPLAVIKHMLRNKAAGAAEFELLDIINKADQSDYYERLPVSEAAKEAKLKPREVEAIISAGLIVPTMSGHNRMCTHGDCRLMKLVKTRMTAGIPLEQSIETFSMYESHLRDTTKKDIESLVRESILVKALSTEDIMNIINVSDETLDSFIGMKRYAMNASLGAEYIEKTEKLLPRLDAFGKGVSAILRTLSYAGTAEKLEKALAGEESADKPFALYSELLRISGTGLANTLSVLLRAGNYLKETGPRTDRSELNMAYDALRLGFMTFAPEEFGYDPVKAETEFVDNTADKAFTESVLRLIQKLRD